MQLSKVKRFVSDTMLNFRGWNTNRKIVVIESDDWGSVRMPSKEVYDRLLKENIRVDKCPYNSYDSLESEEDLMALFEVLRRHGDKNTNPAVITANFIMSNPDFDSMKQDKQLNYKSELFTETYKKYHSHSSVFACVKEGIEEGMFRAQCHGREHVNIRRWLQFLINGSPETDTAYRHNLFGLSQTITNEKRGSFLAAYDYSNESEKDEYGKIVQEGLQLFYDTFNYHSASFIAPNYCWDDEIEHALFESKVKLIQSGRVQIKPSLSGRSQVKHYTGKENALGQVYTVRNCHFEPSLRKDRASALNTCLKEIETAFIWNTPAIICAHRLNFIGSIRPENRGENLALLDALLAQIVRRWPGVEFMSSDQLGQLILSEKTALNK